MVIRQRNREVKAIPISDTDHQRAAELLRQDDDK
jgi:hypothetical protein